MLQRGQHRVAASSTARTPVSRVCGSSSCTKALPSARRSGRAANNATPRPRLSAGIRCRAAAQEPISDPDSWPWQSPYIPTLQKDADPARIECERSSLVNTEMVYFIFQQELDMQLQRALNYDAFDAAQQIRQKREMIDQSVAALHMKKAAASAGAVTQSTEEELEAAAAAAAKVTLKDLAAEGLRMRMDLTKSIEEERYEDAAKLRDLLTSLEQRMKQITVDAERWSLDGASSSSDAGERTTLFWLGQRVVHKLHGYRAVVVGWDNVCCENKEWIARSGASQLPGGLAQPFYHLLVDQRDWQFDATSQPIAYAAQELLTAPSIEDGASWIEVYGSDKLLHEYTDLLFIGPDARGDMVPSKQLRERYNVPRRDVYPPGEEDAPDSDDPEEDSGSSEASSDGGSGSGGGGGGGSSGGGKPPRGPIIPGIDMSSLQ